MSQILFKNIKIFDGTGKKLCAGEVLVQGNMIQKVATGTKKIRTSNVKVVDGETVLISNGFAPTFGAAWDTSSYAKQWELLSGRPPMNSKELVMDKTTADNNSFNIGDKVTVLAGAIPATFKIVGIAQFSEVGSPGGATFALFDFRKR